MTPIQWFAFVILPISISVFGYFAVRLFEYAYPLSRTPDVPDRPVGTRTSESLPRR